MSYKRVIPRDLFNEGNLLKVAESGDQMKYQLSRDIELLFLGHIVRAKKGTSVQMIPDGRGLPCYTLYPANVETGSHQGRGSLWRHDTKYYYIWAPNDAVECLE